MNKTNTASQGSENTHVRFEVTEWWRARERNGGKERTIIRSLAKARQRVLHT